MSKQFPRWKAGFTMIEVLVSLVISAVLAGTIFQLLNGQSRFVDVQNARQEVQDNARGVLDLLLSDLQATPPGAIDSAGGRRIVLYSPRSWGIICGGAAGDLYVAFPPGVVAQTGLPAASDLANSGWRLNAPRTTAGLGSLYYPPATMSSIVKDNSFNPGGCGAMGVDASVIDVYRVQHNAFPDATLSVPAIPNPTLTPGTRVFVSELVAYDVRDGGIRRNNGGGNREIFAGPVVHADSALRVTYICRNTVLDTLTFLASAGAKNRIDRVRVWVQTRSSTQVSGSSHDREVDSVSVQLRNSPGNLACT